MDEIIITEKDREMAKQCVECTICKKACVNQKGILFLIVKFLEGSVCPYCKAYERVYGRKAHEPVKG